MNKLFIALLIAFIVILSKMKFYKETTYKHIDYVKNGKVVRKYIE